MLPPLGVSILFSIRSQVGILPSFHNSLEFAAYVGMTCINLGKKYLHVFVDNLPHMKGLSALSYAKLPDSKVSRRELRQLEMSHMY